MSEVEAPPSRVAVENAAVSGWLSKRGELNRAWQQRWCVLVDATLWYFKNKEARTPLKGIKLDQCVVRQTDGDRSRPHCFEIVTKQRAFLLAAESRDALHKWLEELAACTTLQSENLLIERAEHLIREAMRDHRRRLLLAADAAAAAPVADFAVSSTASVEPVVASSSSSTSTSSSSATSRRATVVAASADEHVAPRFETKREWAVEALRAGSFEVARDLLLELLDINDKDPFVLYDLACAEALLRHKPDAFRYLELALKNGFMNVDALQNDPDLHNIRILPEWQPMMQRYNAALHVAKLMQQPETGVETRKRTWLLKSFEASFVGREAVDWLLNNRFADSRDGAVSLARELMARGLIRNVGDDERDFEDGTALYAFVREDEQQQQQQQPIAVQQQQTQQLPQSTPPAENDISLRAFGDLQRGQQG